MIILTSMPHKTAAGTFLDLALVQCDHFNAWELYEVTRLSADEPFDQVPPERALYLMAGNGSSIVHSALNRALRWYDDPEGIMHLRDVADALSSMLMNFNAHFPAPRQAHPPS